MSVSDRSRGQIFAVREKQTARVQSASSDAIQWITRGHFDGRGYGGQCLFTFHCLLQFVPQSHNVGCAAFDLENKSLRLTGS